MATPSCAYHIETLIRNLNTVTSWSVWAKSPRLIPPLRDEILPNALCCAESPNSQNAERVSPVLRVSNKFLFLPNHRFLVFIRIHNRGNIPRSQRKLLDFRSMLSKFVTSNLRAPRPLSNVISHPIPQAAATRELQINVRETGCLVFPPCLHTSNARAMHQSG